MPQTNQPRKPAFVLIHGAWHGAWAWNDLIPRLAAAGHPAVAADLPGCGTRARHSAAFLAQPQDAAAQANDPSPVADITQAERASDAVRLVKAAAAAYGGKVIVVGHSWGGLTLSHAAQAAPDSIHALVYLAAIMLPNGMSALDMLGDPAFQSSQTPALLLGDPQKTGALRINPRSQDAAYIAAAKAAYYADIDEQRHAAIAALQHSDEPAQTAAQPMATSADKFAALPRHYIRMTEDRAVPLAAQDRMIALTDADAGNQTQIHTLAGGHSPFFAQPDALAQTLLAIAS